MTPEEQKANTTVFNNVKRYPQPSPGKNPGGDCFACALTAAVSWMYPENHPTFDEVWDCFKGEYHDGTIELMNAWHNYQNAFENINKLGYPMEYVADMYLPAFKPSQRNYSFYHEYSTAIVSISKVFKLVSDYITKGYILYTAIDIEGKGPVHSGRPNSSDHIVLIDGVRHWTRWREDFDFKAGDIIQEVHVVCSANEENSNWRSIDDMIHKFGFASFWAIRKKPST